MSKRSWATYRPSNLRDALEACVDFARERHQMSIDRIADAIGIPSKWSLYKYIEGASLPARLIRPFENACRCQYVTQFLAASARKLLIDVPIGRKASDDDLHLVQMSCTIACGSLLAFQHGGIDPARVIAAVSDAIERLARERAEIERHDQPELPLP